MKDFIKGLLFEAAFFIAGVTLLIAMFNKNFHDSRYYPALMLVALFCLIGFFVFPAGE